MFNGNPITMEKNVFASNKQNKQMKTLTNFVTLLTGELEQSGRHGTARAYRSSLNRLLEFTGNDRLTFTDLTPGLLKRYEQQLLTQGCKITAVQFATVTGLTQSVQFPGKFIRGSSNWSGGGDATLYLWNAQSTGAKTVFDPCPAGWRVPAFYGAAGTPSSTNYSPWRYWSNPISSLTFTNTEN